MAKTDLGEYATGELLWELQRRAGIVSSETGPGGEITVRATGPAVVLIVKDIES